MAGNTFPANFCKKTARNFPWNRENSSSDNSWEVNKFWHKLFQIFEIFFKIYQTNHNNFKKDTITLSLQNYLWASTNTKD